MSKNNTKGMKKSYDEEEPTYKNLESLQKQCAMNGKRMLLYGF
jgi:hypothetical protein